MLKVGPAVQSEQDMTECSQLEERKGDSCGWPYQVNYVPT